jgi:nucleoside-diphosphate-sugar epimerase
MEQPAREQPDEPDGLVPDNVIDLEGETRARRRRSGLAVVTGAAGFVGSTLCQALVDAGHTVVGIDAFVSNYPREQKLANLAELLGSPAFRFVEDDLVTADLDALLDGAELVFHQAGQPGVRTSWANGFPAYVANNVVATQRLLEAANRSGSVQRVVYASSSSVYGDRVPWPTNEQAVPHPLSPYGVTKLAAEHLCSLYAENHGVPVVSLRYFTVYGPGQRTDMAFTRFVRATVLDEVISLYGTGEQVRDFTFVDDVHCPEVAGDVHRTGGSIDLARQLMGWEPTVELRDGLRSLIAWQRSRSLIYDAAPAGADRL